MTNQEIGENQPTKWSCPHCPWEQRAHPVYGWAEHDERSVEVHLSMLCRGLDSPMTATSTPVAPTAAERATSRTSEEAASVGVAPHPNATRAQATGVMWYLEGWLSGDHPEASRYLRDHVEEIADAMVGDECADPDPGPLPVATVRGEVEAGQHPHTSTCAWTVADDPCTCGVDDSLAARVDAADHQTWERRIPGTNVPLTRIHLAIGPDGRALVHEANLAQLLVDAGWERAQ